MLDGQLLDLLNRRIEADVRIEVSDRSRIVVRQEMLQQPRLDRGRELGHVIHRRHRLEAVDAQRVRAHDAERLSGFVYVLVAIIDHEHDALATRVLGEE